MILVINSGSSSVKYKMFDMAQSDRVLAKGVIDRVGVRGSGISNHNAAIRLILERLSGNNKGGLKKISEIRAVGHRVVHGGEKFKSPVIIDRSVLKAIGRFSRLAPLHNPPNLAGIKACRRFLPDVPQVAVFDTAYYQTLPPSHYLYALPYGLYKRYGIRRYGFHGTSHKYVAIKTGEILKKKSLKIITCHLGNGCSITATINREAIDTSMGFTPLEGLVMGTRSGDIDPIIALYLMKKAKMTQKGVDCLLNKKSGLLGISGISSDMRDVYRALKLGRKKAKLAFDIFVHRIQKYIGAFSVYMNGVDALTFSGGIGENHPPAREAICRNLRFLGVRIDRKKNNENQIIISERRSRIKVLVVPTDEESMIALETKNLICRYGGCQRQQSAV